MIKTALKNRFRNPKTRGAGAGDRGAGDLAQRQEGGLRRDRSTVVHPWLSLPEKLAATQAAMQELAGSAAFSCPLNAVPLPKASSPADRKPRSTGVNIVFRKRRIPAAATPELR